MLTPAQKPRGLARMIFIQRVLLNSAIIAIGPHGEQGEQVRFAGGAKKKPRVSELIRGSASHCRRVTELIV
jgi:hypothetical protein